MRRKQDVLFLLESTVMMAALDLCGRGEQTFYGFRVAKAIQAHADAGPLKSQGTLYKTLARLERLGLLTSSWEDPSIAAQERRPQRHLYQITTAGHLAAAARGYTPGQEGRLEQQPLML